MDHETAHWHRSVHDPPRVRASAWLEKHGAGDNVVGAREYAKAGARVRVGPEPHTRSVLFVVRLTAMCGPPPWRRTAGHACSGRSRCARNRVWSSEMHGSKSGRGADVSD